jgi:thioredoxin-like negative regulator of GroEL
MRLLVACLVLIIVPPLAVFGFKEFKASQLEREQYPQMDPQMDSLSKRGEVLFFNAAWCGPCRAMKPVVGQLRRQGYRMRDIDVDKNQTLAQKYGIRSVPTFVFVENGSEVNRFSGGTSAEKLKQLCPSPTYR